MTEALRPPPNSQETEKKKSLSEQNHDRRPCSDGGGWMTHQELDWKHIQLSGALPKLQSGEGGEMKVGRPAEASGGAEPISAVDVGAKSEPRAGNVTERRR